MPDTILTEKRLNKSGTNLNKSVGTLAPTCDNGETSEVSCDEMSFHYWLTSLNFCCNFYIISNKIKLTLLDQFGGQCCPMGNAHGCNSKGNPHESICVNSMASAKVEDIGKATRPI